ncbi:hypothetical protein KIL84_017850, partial [Mauremys mutica]
GTGPTGQKSQELKDQGHQWDHRNSRCNEERRDTGTRNGTIQHVSVSMYVDFDCKVYGPMWPQLVVNMVKESELDSILPHMSKELVDVATYNLALTLHQCEGSTKPPVLLGRELCHGWCEVTMYLFWLQWALLFTLECCEAKPVTCCSSW